MRDLNREIENFLNAQNLISSLFLLSSAMSTRNGWNKAIH